MLSDTILKKYSSTVATIFTGIASAALFGHVITMNFLLGISIVFISMHQVKPSYEPYPWWIKLHKVFSVEFINRLIHV